jgi:hypothetical protein
VQAERQAHLGKEGRLVQAEQQAHLEKKGRQA